MENRKRTLVVVSQGTARRGTWPDPELQGVRTTERPRVIGREVF